MEFPEPIVKKAKGPKRGSHASAKRYQKTPENKSKPAPQGRGKFAKPKRKGKTGAAGKPGGKYQGKFAPRNNQDGNKGSKK